MLHDAADFLSWLFEHSNLGYECCHVGVGPRCDNEVVLLEEFMSPSSQADICKAERIDMQTLLRSSLQHDATRLRRLPLLLVLRVPQFIHEDDAGEVERAWVQLEGANGSFNVPACWGDGFLDFSTCCAPDCRNTEEAIYRIKSYVHYCIKS